MKPLHDTPEPSTPERRHGWVWALFGVAVLVLSVLSLLGIPVGVYDDSFLLLDARLVRGGSLPYLDFYTHYGPLGYTLIAMGYGVVHNPGLLLRVLQGACLAATALLLLLMSRGERSAVGAGLAPAGAAISLFAVANVFRSPAFLGFVFSVAALAMAVLSRRTSSPGVARLLAGAAGVALALAGLVRPVFGAYAGVAIAAVGLAEIDASGERREGWLRLLAVTGAALVSISLIWFFLYRRIALGVALKATIFDPGRLMGGGERFLNPRFLLSPTGSVVAAWGGALAVGLLAAASSAWIASARSSSTRLLVPIAGVVAALGAARLEASPNPAPEATLIAGLMIAIGLAAVFRMRREIADSPAIAAGALFGIAAIAFGHYFWARPDRAHLAPAAGLAVVAAAFAWPRLATAGRILAVATLGAIVLLFPQLPLRAAAAAIRGASVWTRPFPAGTVPRDAAEAVRFADAHSDPKSRFVAVASTHAVTSANPVLLFLLSSRRPYTRWYTYDPGVQDSPAVQEEMAKELERSGSRAAIVWDARLYVFEPRVANLMRKTPFDQVFDRLYPVRAARFGEFEVRFRAE